MKTLSLLLMVSFERTEAAVNDNGVEMIIHRQMKLISSKINEAEITKDHSKVVIINARSNYLIDGWNIWYSTRMNSITRWNSSRENIPIEISPFEKEQMNTYTIVRAVFNPSVWADLLAKASSLTKENFVYYLELKNPIQNNHKSKNYNFISKVIVKS